MRRKSLARVAVAASICLTLAACGDDSTETTSPGQSPASGGEGASADGTVGVILPDATTSPRWESADRPFLEAAFEEAGIEADIQNAGGNVSTFGTLCDGMINQGVAVLMIVNLDSDSGSACLGKAQDAGIQTIDYDRLTLGGGAAFYVSFDNVEVGRTMGEGLITCLDDAGTTSANIVLINGDPTDNNAALFKEGYEAALQPKVDSGDYTIVGDQTGEWDADVAGTAFEQLFTQNNGDVDGIVSANDTMAQGIIARLSANGLNGQVPVTGQDASVEGLQAILAGDQCMTVYKAIEQEANAAAELAIALINGEDAEALATGSVTDTVLDVEVPSVLETPQAIFRDNVKDVIDDGFQEASDVCTGQFQAACEELGIS
ncbi:substrate-binding domain-containing protein [soil metagenome]